ncbi:Transposon Ty3-I Gag-Pol polyprotein [Salix suchowensis]|nr:Transposon Ty3-I Gag-Pol polyprotein [Salix suchowensis]
MKVDQSDWVAKLPMVKFTLNSSLNSTTGLAPFEANYGFLLSMMNVHHQGLEFTLGIAVFAEKACQNLTNVYDTNIECCVFQTYHANNKHCDEPSIKVEDFVYLSTGNLSLPNYIGPYKVMKALPDTFNYILELPATEPYNWGAPDDTKWIVDDIIAYRWQGKTLQFQERRSGAPPRRFGHSHPRYLGRMSVLSAIGASIVHDCHIRVNLNFSRNPDPPLG